MPLQSKDYKTAQSDTVLNFTAQQITKEHLHYLKNKHIWIYLLILKLMVK